MLTLNATIRGELGKKNKKLRRENKLPGVLYGRKVKSTPVSVAYKDFEKIYEEAGESTLVSLELDNDKDSGGVPKENVILIRDTVVHPLSRAFMHVDFYQVPMDEEIEVSIPLAFENESAAVKNEGAVLVRNIYELEVRALPKDLPHEIIVDLSRLQHTDDAIVVKDLPVPPGVTVKAEEDTVVAGVEAPQEEEIIQEAPEEVAAEDIKTEAEEKREEEAEEEAEAGETA